jgi:Trp operon repressor
MKGPEDTDPGALSFSEVRAMKDEARVVVGAQFGPWVVVTALDGPRQQAVVECKTCGPLSQRLCSAYALVHQRFRACSYCDPERREAFWRSVWRVAPTAEDPDPCWWWLGALQKDGYGTVSINNDMVLAHRVSWVFANGPFKGDNEIHHKCRNRKCVNPAHLEALTKAEHEAQHSGDHACGQDHGQHTRPDAYAHLRGDGHWQNQPGHEASAQLAGRRSLTTDQVREVVRLLVETDETQGEIAQRFHVSQSEVSDIGNGRVWKEITLAEGLTSMDLRRRRKEARDRDIAADLAAGLTWPVICEKHKVSNIVITRVRREARLGALAAVRVAASPVLVVAPPVSVAPIERLDDGAVRAILRLLADTGTSQLAIAEAYGVCVATVCSIGTGRIWRHLSVFPDGTTAMERRHAREESARKTRDAAIVADLAAGLTQRAVAAKHGVSATAVARLSAKASPPVALPDAQQPPAV